MRSLGTYAVLLLDVNALTNSDDVKPTRQQVLREALLAAAEKLYESGAWVATVVVARQALPLHFFTRDPSVTREALESLSLGPRGLVIAEGVKESLYLLLSAPPGYALRLLMFSGGGFRVGHPPQPLAFFARSAGVVIDALVVSRSQPPRGDIEVLDVLCNETGGVWEHASTREEAIAKAVMLASRSVGARPGRVWRPGLGLYPPRQLYTRGL